MLVSYIQFTWLELFVKKTHETPPYLTESVLHTVQINFQAVDVNKYRYIQTPIGLLIF